MRTSSSSRTSAALAVTFLCHDTAPSPSYTLSLHDALPISAGGRLPRARPVPFHPRRAPRAIDMDRAASDDCRVVYTARSEEHTSELQSRVDVVCRLLLEKKNAPETRIPAGHVPAPPPVGYT